MSRSYSWDGPKSDDDLTYGPECTRGAPSAAPADCNAKMTTIDKVGYVGGTKASCLQLNNPYFPDF